MEDILENNLARQACAACKRQKRKCTRELPACQLCRKSRRPCAYPAETSSTSRVGDSPVISNENIVLFFLDCYAFGRRQLSAEPKPGSIPGDLLSALEDGDRLRGDVGRYFETIHKFFPIVSKLRFQRLLSNESEPTPDTVLILLTLRLLCCDDSSEAASLYAKCRKCLLLTETTGCVSVRLLQASILMTLYELANAIYPAAYLGVGRCARLGYAMGIHDRRNASQMFSPPGSWTQMEEVRRTWWAVLVLDRAGNLGLDNRPFACADAKPEDLLPMDEELWEAGDVTVIPSLAISANTDIPAPPFARTCQAAHLLSRVLGHINDKPSNPKQFYEEGMVLHNLLQAFTSALSPEIWADDERQFISVCTASGICYSALLALYDHHTCPDADDPSGIGIPEQLKMQEVALSSLKSLGGLIVPFAATITKVVKSHGAIVISPLVADCLYAAAKQYFWYARETANREIADLAGVLTEALGLLGTRWDVANRYLAVLDGADFQIPS